ncbi:hypothetical protein BaRGS_00028914 [Batillaria attramentaria]|uniref:Uncharacterized protein n=1 Tax=Batillaria attramentaria TaxID=370345 RepID=A0ABD0JYR5_9CAEN
MLMDVNRQRRLTTRKARKLQPEEDHPPVFDVTRSISDQARFEACKGPEIPNCDQLPRPKDLKKGGKIEKKRGGGKRKDRRRENAWDAILEVSVPLHKSLQKIRKILLSIVSHLRAKPRVFSNNPTAETSFSTELEDIIALSL